MDYNQIMQQATAQQNAVNNSMQMPPTPLPQLNTGTPVINDQTYRDVIARALQSQFQPNPNDVNSARMKMFTAMAQPRMPGQSVAGNITSALQTGTDALDQARARAQELAMRQATMASAIQSQDATRRAQEMQLQSVAAKFPTEVAMAQEQYKQLLMTGQVAKAQIFKQMFQANPEVVLEQFKTGQAKEAAITAKTLAEANKAQSEADFYKEVGKQKEGVTAMPDGTLVQHGIGKDGKPYTVQIIPGNPNATMQDAKAALEKEQKANTPGWHPLGYGLPTITPEQIQQRLQEMQRARVIPLNIGNSGADTQSAPVATAKPVAPEAPPGSATNPIMLGQQSQKSIQDQSQNTSTATTSTTPSMTTVPTTTTSTTLPQVSPQSLQESMKVPPQTQIARDHQALQLVQQELATAIANGESPQEIAKINRDIIAKQRRLQKMILAMGGQQ